MIKCTYMIEIQLYLRTVLAASSALEGSKRVVHNICIYNQGTRSLR